MSNQYGISIDMSYSKMFAVEGDSSFFGNILVSLCTTIESPLPYSRLNKSGSST